MPAEIESKTPYAIKVVCLSGENDLRTPRPTAIAAGVEIAYAKASQ